MDAHQAAQAEQELQHALAVIYERHYDSHAVCRSCETEWQVRPFGIDIGDERKAEQYCPYCGTEVTYWRGDTRRRAETTAERLGMNAGIVDVLLRLWDRRAEPSFKRFVRKSLKLLAK